jgi:SAM-dependent methyltransferase
MTLPSEYFDDVYAGSTDPWGFTERFYEQRKYAVTVAVLPQPHYRSGLEIGCSIGVLTTQLAERCDALTAVDVAAAAVAQARERTAAQPAVTVEQRSLPGDGPSGPYDLIVLSEVGYYFSESDLDVLVEQLRDALEPGGTLLAVHWRHPVADYPQSGDAVHARLDAERGWTATVRHVEDDFLLTVYLRTPPEARSVAQQAGLA